MTENQQEVENVEITEDMLKYGKSAQFVERMKVVSDDYSNHEVHGYTLDHSIIICGLSIIMLHMEIPFFIAVTFGLYGIIQIFHSQRNSFVMRKIRGE